jgi:hypothetical protein
MGNRRRSKTEEFVLYAEHQHGLRPIGRTSRERGDGMVAGGSAIELFDEAGRFAGYQVIEKEQPKDETPNYVTVAWISPQEVFANAGLFGISLTLNLSEEERLSRYDTRASASSKGMHRLLPAEDFIERAQAKVALWPEIGDRQAPRVSPKG